MKLSTQTAKFFPNESFEERDWKICYGRRRHGPAGWQLYHYCLCYQGRPSRIPQYPENHSIPALAPGIDPASKNIMRHKPVKSATLFEKNLVHRVIVQGIFVAAMTTCTYWISAGMGGHATGQTMAFCVLAFSQMLRAFKWKRPLSGNVSGTAASCDVCLWSIASDLLQAGYTQAEPLFFICPVFAEQTL